MIEKSPDGCFWKVIEDSKRSLRRLCRQLEQMPREELISYQQQYEKFKAIVNPLYREDYDSFAEDDWACSEDGADDFAAWVVMQGQSFFDEMFADPAQLFAQAKAFEEAGEDGTVETRWDENVDRREYRGYQRADSIATAIYRMRFGEELGDAL
jgi:hypothetical protein